MTAKTPDNQTTPSPLEAIVATLAVGCFRRPALALTLLAISVVAGLSITSKLTFDADMIALLPESFQSVQDLEKLKKRYGGAGTLTIFAHGAEPDSLVAFAKDLAPKLEELESIRYVNFERPNKYFQDRGLYYLEEADLVSLRDQMQARYDWERLHANPLYIDLNEEENKEPPPFDLTTIEALEEKYVGGSSKSMVRKGKKSPYYLDEEAKAIAIMARPSGLASNLDFTAKVVAEVEGVVAALNPASYDPNLKVEYTGRYKKRLDLQALASRDLKVASLLAAALMLLYLVFHFRRAFAVILIFCPLLVGIVWTFAFATLTFGSLNILTGLIGAVLLGLGIDHGIHLLTSYQDERQRDQEATAALSHAFTHTGRAVFLAALTTGVGFAGPAFSEFRAFHEFGTIAAGGMLLIMLSYLTVLPTLLAFADKLGWKPSTQAATRTPILPGMTLRHRGRAFLLTAAVLVLTLGGLRFTSFNYDFGGLEGGKHLRSVKLDHEVNRILGHSQSPLLIIGDDGQDANRVADYLRSQQETLGSESAIDFVATRADLIPEGQESKALVIADIRAIAKKVRGRKLKRELRRKLRQLKKMSAHGPFTMADVPRPVQQQFETLDGSPADGFLLVYPSVELSQGLEVRRLAQEIRGTPMPQGGTVAAASESMVMADILNMVFRESPKVLLLTLVAVFFTVLMLLRNLRDTLLALSPAAITMVMTAGLLPFVNVQFDYLNIIMIPVLFGLGVDGGIHIVTKLKAEGSLEKAMSVTGRAITGALFTSALGFAAMFSTDHSGLRSLAAVALVGLASNLLACMVGLPSLLNLGRSESQS
ncbi:MAG: MMPL family transporter [Myxococcota bacterium]|nr:MMPL family transporter [Myxococcota bacterium]